MLFLDTSRAVPSVLNTIICAICSMRRYCKNIYSPFARVTHVFPCLQVSVLVFRRMERSIDRRQAAHVQRTADLHALHQSHRILGRAIRKSLRQVSSERTPIAQTLITNSSRFIEWHPNGLKNKNKQKINSFRIRSQFLIISIRFVFIFNSLVDV